MKVKIGDLKPNPFRHLESYPIDPVKVERLSKSIKHTGFWDNIVARKEKGEIQIAYGHHRLAALKKAYGLAKEVDVILKDLDDATMIQVMADENDDVYNLLPSVINETVRAAREYLIGVKKLNSVRTESEATTIADFLDWNKSRIYEALANIHAIDKGEVVKEIETLPSQEHITVLRSEAKKLNLSPSIQKKVIETIKKEGTGYRQVKEQIHKYTSDGIKKEAEFEELLKETAQAIRIADNKVKDVLKRRGNLKCGKGFVLLSDTKGLVQNLQKLWNLVKEEKKGEIK